MGEKNKPRPLTSKPQLEDRAQRTPETNAGSDAESDPEFVNNAPYVYEKKTKLRGGRVSGRDSRRKSQRDQHVVRSRDSQESKGRTLNVLHSLFGNVLQNAAESSEDDHHDSVAEGDEDADGSDFAEESASKSLPRDHPRRPQPRRPTPRGSETFSVSVNSSMEKASNGPSSSRQKYTETNNDDDSATESDSEAEDMFASLGTQFRDGQPVSGRSLNDAKPGGITTTESGTETETDDDDELDDPFDLRLRPSFPRESTMSFAPLRLDDASKIEVPASVNEFLREYQREGVRFFWDRFTEGRGGVLGDDMGLGKTIQVISFLSAIMKKYGDARDVNRRRKHVSLLQDSEEWTLHRSLPAANASWPTCLIIAPSSVVHNWQREFETWGYFEVGMYIGPPEERSGILKDFKFGRLDVIITTFDTARSDIQALYDLPWSVIFVDEAHRIKNPSSKITKAFNTFQCEARFGLTGTAIQNTYEELWTLLDWSNPDRVGSLKEWKKCISKPLAIGQSAKASEGERALAKAVANILVHKILPMFFLRRTKHIIRDQLPKKIDEVVFCPLTPQQILVYKRMLSHREERIKANGPGPFDDTIPCDCDSGLTRTRCCYVMDAPHFFTYLTIFMKISNHLALILPSPNDTEEQIKRNREISRIAFRDKRNIPKYGPAILSPQYCGKWDVLNTLLREWRKGNKNKVLVFTKSVKLLEMLDYHLNCNSYSFCRLDGSTKPGDRMGLIDTFNHDPSVFVFLISTLAGGTGLNLTAANKVVIFDPNWNPAHDLQAMDRAYRFGQTRDVNVYRLLGAGSVEELIYARQVYKQQMMMIGYEASHQTRYFEGVQGDTKRRGELFGSENLFKLHENTLATKMAIEKAHLAEFDWALANMAVDGKGKRVDKTSEKEALELEARQRIGEEGDLRGLASLLLDDDAPSTQHTQTADDISQILSAGNIKYTHQNDELLRPSRVEEESLRDSLNKLRKRKADELTKEQERRTRRARVAPEPEPEPEEWPPKRRHHKPPLSPRSTLRVRQKALLETGMVGSTSELPAFAAKFGGMSPEEQQEVVAKLDRHYTRNR